ncbi:NAD(P)H-dependent oxidoreductase [Micromonospora sp. DT233]|uniref:NAD(P)H-dependent oxidoreductase n=1 Tax=Micromonospora sp. DT233 TaxID=3393432 RepID=UPI003CFA4ED7
MLKNAIDYLYGEWHNKSAGFVSYGLDGGVGAVEHSTAVSFPRTRAVGPRRSRPPRPAGRCRCAAPAWSAPA